jgi:tetratricopeptide (TPR) repeat protein
MLRASGEPIPIRTRVPDIDPRWEGAIRRCLQKDPARRFASAAELAAWFRGGWLRPPRYWTRQDWIRNTGAVAVLALTLSGGWTVWTRPYRPTPAALQAYEAGVGAMHSMAYETARRALEQSVAADPEFALAHAVLARAYEELDYTDRAKDSMLTAIAAAQESRLSQDDERRLRALQFMVSRDYERALPLVRQIEADTRGVGGSGAALESGWLAQQMDDSEEAAEAFERALALEAFGDAERLYGVAGDYEGVTQALLERANLLVRRSRQREALSIIDQALTVARTVGNRHQEVRLLLLEGTALRDLDQTADAIARVRQAIDLAGTQNMDNLATNGQIDLGNIHLRIGDLDAAEPIFQRALEMAARSKVRRIEARARMAIGSLYEQRRRPEQAAPLVQAGLSFYNQAGYRRESVQASVLLGGLLQQLGEIDESVRVLRGALPGVEQLQDRRLEAQLRERTADALRAQGNWPEAVAEYERAGSRHPSPVQTGLLRVRSAGLQWRLGQRDEAAHALGDSSTFEGRNPDPRLSLRIALERAEMAYADARLGEAAALARQRTPEGADEQIARQIALLRARVLIRQGRGREGLRSAAAVIEAYEADRLPGEAAEARLSVAEALSVAGEHDMALPLAQDALAYVEAKQVWEAAWRGHMIAAQASQDPSSVDGHRTAARSALIQLRRGWTAAALDRYLARPDVMVLARGLRL